MRRKRAPVPYGTEAAAISLPVPAEPELRVELPASVGNPVEAGVGNGFHQGTEIGTLVRPPVPVEQGSGRRVEDPATDGAQVGTGGAEGEVAVFRDDRDVNSGVTAPHQEVKSTAHAVVVENVKAAHVCLQGRKVHPSDASSITW